MGMRGGALRGSKIVAFFTGCLLGSLLSAHLGYALFYVPALAVAAAAAMLHVTLRRRSRHGSA
jgi:hypothetical protein